MSEILWRCFVPGEPKAMQTGSVIRAGTRLIPVRRHTEWGNRVALAAYQTKPANLFSGPLVVTLRFFRTRPKSVKKGMGWPITRPDLENCSKGVLDALQGIVYHDDAQIVRLILEKCFQSDPGVQIVVGVPHDRLGEAGRERGPRWRNSMANSFTIIREGTVIFRAGQIAEINDFEVEGTRSQLYEWAAARYVRLPDPLPLKWRKDMLESNSLPAIRARAKIANGWFERDVEFLASLCDELAGALRKVAFKSQEMKNAIAKYDAANAGEKAT